MTALPSSWALCEIGDVLAPIQMTGKDEPDRYIWYIDISSIDNQTNRIADPKRLQMSEAPSRARQKVIAGDVLFSTVRPYLRKIAAVDTKYNGEIASTGFAVLRGANGIEPKYLFYKAISHDFVSALTGEQYGVSYPAVKEEQVKAQPLELAPTKEQRRIVEKIEALFDEIDKGVESLQTARTTLGLYRQSLLKSAFEGRLTADWRAQNADKLEAPETFLARIKRERDTRYKAALDEWQDALAQWRADGEKGRKPAKPRLPADVGLLCGKEIAELENLPNGWAWIRLGELFWLSPKNGVYKPSTSYGNGASIIRIDDFYEGKLSKRTGFKRLELTSEELQQYEVSSGDILINRVNSLEYLGKCAEVPDLDEPTVFESNIMKCHAVTDATSSSWIVRYLTSQRGKDRIRQFAKHAVNQASINQTDVASTQIPVCSPTEQAEIVRRLDARLEAADAMEAEIDAALNRADALRQSILKKAFTGQLIPQDPNDEPADVLLTHIKAGRRKTPKVRRMKTADA